MKTEEEIKLIYERLLEQMANAEKSGMDITTMCAAKAAIKCILNHPYTDNYHRVEGWQKLLDELLSKDYVSPS
jgi:predicted amino acid dehydrogenase